MKRQSPSWAWWLLGGRKETKALKFLPKEISQSKGRDNKKRNELESFGSSSPESVAGDGPEWSVGWTEPHGPDFQIDDESDDGGFLVLVPCYRLSPGMNNQLLSAFKEPPNGISPDGKNKMEQWLSSLQNL